MTMVCTTIFTMTPCPAETRLTTRAKAMTTTPLTHSSSWVSPCHLRSLFTTGNNGRETTKNDDRESNNNSSSKEAMPLHHRQQQQRRRLRIMEAFSRHRVIPTLRSGLREG